jgi:hypothetical protein
MNIIYRITYLPHLKNQTPPYYYVGSKLNYSQNYWGSPSSSQKDWYTESLSISKWWKKKIKENVNNFLFEIISQHSDHTPIELVEEEKKVHLYLNVKNSIEYFNKSIATTGWVSVPRTNYTKEKIKSVTKEYWNQNTPEVIERKKQLSERNKKIKSKQLKEKWKNPSNKMKENYEKFVAMAKSHSRGKDKTKRKSRPTQKVYCCGIIYENAIEASNAIGIDPVNVRRKCRLDQYPDWYYLN